MSVTREKAAQLMADAGHTLQKVSSERDKLAEENVELREKNSSLLRRMEAEKVAAEMHDKGIHTEVPYDVLAEQLEKEAEQGNLPVIQQALHMTGPDMLKSASLSDGSGVGASELESYILGTVG